MRVLFAGPSLSGTAADAAERVGDTSSKLQLRGPAAQGDITRAVLDGAAVIGLIDGIFEDVAAVWHKEILFALAQGVHVLGAASMGALRAAECERFGMVGVGEVFRGFASGELLDDDAVAQLHAPAELGYRPLTEALVNIEATFRKLLELDLLSDGEAERLVSTARRTFFKERTYRNIVLSAGLPPERHAQAIELAAAHRLDLKRSDALQLTRLLQAMPAVRRAPSTSWEFQATGVWLRWFGRLHGPAAEKREAGVT